MALAPYIEIPNTEISKAQQTHAVLQKYWDEDSTVVCMILDDDEASGKLAGFLRRHIDDLARSQGDELLRLLWVKSRQGLPDSPFAGFLSEQCKLVIVTRERQLSACWTTADIPSSDASIDVRAGEALLAARAGETL